MSLHEGQSADVFWLKTLLYGKGVYGMNIYSLGIGSARMDCPPAMLMLKLVSE